MYIWLIDISKNIFKGYVHVFIILKQERAEFLFLTLLTLLKSPAFVSSACFVTQVFDSQCIQIIIIEFQDLLWPNLKE